MFVGSVLALVVLSAFVIAVCVFSSLSPFLALFVFPILLQLSFYRYRDTEQQRPRDADTQRLAPGPPEFDLGGWGVGGMSFVSFQRDACFF